MASDFSASNYITKSSIFGTAQTYSSLKFTIGFTADTSQNSRLCQIRTSDNNNQLTLYYGTAGKLQFHINANGGSYYPTAAQSNLTITNTHKYLVDYEQTGTSATIVLTDLETNIKQNQTFTVPGLLVLNENTVIYYGYSFQGSDYCRCPIDLNLSTLYIIGNLVYQPCLLIPYTLSKTGSKVVDVAYRPRVADMYEQFGIAPYYTIDEANANFTLPMGEIYGGKLDRTIPHIVENYRNGASWYRVWSDGLIEQGGDLTLGTNSYTFVKSYSSNPRVFLQLYTNNSAAATNAGVVQLNALPTTTGFSTSDFSSTYWEGGFWHARGY